MHIWQSLGAAIMLVSASVGAQAAERNWTLAGDSLKISQTCAKTVDIQAGSAGHGVTIVAQAEKEGEINQLRATGGDVATLDINSSHCFGSAGGWFNLGDKPTLALVIKVPAGAAIDVRDGGVAHYTIGAVGGTLNLSLAGASGLKAVSASTLSLDLAGAGNADIGEAGDTKLHTSGAGNVTIHHLKGTLGVKLAGAGSLAVEAIESSSVDVHASGRSDIKLGKGTIGNFLLDSAGASDVVIDATVGDANVSVAGAGDVRIAKLTGHIKQSIAGVGSVKILEQ